MLTFTVTTNHYEHKLLVFSGSEKKYARHQALRFIAQWMPGTKIKSIRKAKDDDRIKAGYTVEEIPFVGFSQSKYEGILDHAMENEIEYNETRQEENGVPKDLMLDSSEYSDILHRHCDWSKGREAIAEDYVPCFSQVASEWLGLDTYDVMSIEFAGYGLNNQCVFGHVHPIVHQWIMARAMITDYSDDPNAGDFEDMLKHIIETAGHKEHSDFNDFDWRVYELVDQDSTYFENHCVDWRKVEADCAELVDEKAHAYDDDDGNPRRRAIILERCPNTLDLFA